VIRGWRRIGVVLSVLVFFPLAIFLWEQPSADESVYLTRVDACHKQQDFTKARRDACLDKARLDYESTNPPSNSTRLLIIAAKDLLLIGFFWLFAWGCVAVVGYKAAQRSATDRLKSRSGPF
jgi:hypothetical protein